MMKNRDHIDLVALTREHIREHDLKHWAGLTALRAELNDNDSEFSRLREIDLSSEENLSRKLFYALIDENGNAVKHPGLLSISLAGHITRLEVRSSFYGTYATILGAATAIWSIEGKDAIAHILLLGTPAVRWRCRLLGASNPRQQVSRWRLRQVFLSVAVSRFVA